MPISKGELLFELIRSLSKAEKRNFRLYAKRIQGEGEIKILQLLDVLERLDTYDEAAVLNKLKGVTKSQFVNLRRHLYQHLLTSLRLIQLNKRRDIQIRELIDYANILYGKGLHLHALKLLSKAKSMAEAGHHDLLHLEILEFEKLIESRHITRATTDRIHQLMDGAQLRNRVNGSTTDWSNLKLRLQRVFIDQGHARSEKERRRIGQLFEAHRPADEARQPTFFERVYRCESYFWRHYLLLEFEDCLTYAGQWVDLYREKPNMIGKDVDMYLRGLHHLLTTAFYTKDHALLRKTLEELEHFRRKHYKSFNDNSRILSFLYAHQGRLNRCFLEGDFEGAAARLLPKTLRRLHRYEKQLDLHKVMLLHYKIAWLHFGNGAPQQAVVHLKKIIDQQVGYLRDELHAYAHLLFLMTHFELGSYEISDYLLRGADTFFEKLPGSPPLQSTTLRYLKKLFRAPLWATRPLLLDFKAELDDLAGSPLERRDFVFLDVPAWVESRLQQRPLAVIIREKHQQATAPE